jgi:hypothetical protein
LIKDATREASIKLQQRVVRARETFSTTADGKATSEEALGVLLEAENAGLLPLQDE